MEPVETTIGDHDCKDGRRFRQAEDERFMVKDGVRHVYISSLDELRKRLHLDETREVGVPGDEPAVKPKARRKEPVSETVRRHRQDRGPGRDAPEGDPDVDLKIDEQRLADSIYFGPPVRTSRRCQSTNHSTDHPVSRPAEPGVLKRQEVRRAFGSDLRALNDAIFEQSGERALEPTELNSDVDLLIETLSDRLTEASSQEYLHEFARAARDPLGEDV
jgi:hypothetical protein